MNVCLHFDQTRAPKYCELQEYLYAPRDCKHCRSYDPDPCFHERELEGDRERDAFWVALLNRHRILGT